MNPPMQLFGTYFYEKGFNFGTLDELVSRKVATEIEILDYFDIGAPLLTLA